MTSRSERNHNKLGMLTPIRKVGVNSYGKPVWLFQCDCGKQVERTRQTAVRTASEGGTPSCGCYKYQRKNQARTFRTALQDEEAHGANIRSCIDANRASVPASMQHLPSRIISMRHSKGSSHCPSYLPKNHSSAFNMMGAA